MSHKTQNSAKNLRTSEVRLNLGYLFRHMCSCYPTYSRRFFISYRYFHLSQEDQQGLRHICIHLLADWCSHQHFNSVIYSFSGCPDYEISCPPISFITLNLRLFKSRINRNFMPYWLPRCPETRPRGDSCAK